METVISRLRLVLRLFAGFLAFLAYVWFAAVRLLPEVKRRKAARRTAPRRGRS